LGHRSHAQLLRGHQELQDQGNIKIQWFWVFLAKMNVNPPSITKKNKVFHNKQYMKILNKERSMFLVLVYCHRPQHGATWFCYSSDWSHYSKTEPCHHRQPRHHYCSVITRTEDLPGAGILPPSFALNFHINPIGRIS
jgi:hypothetical protein